MAGPKWHDTYGNFMKHTKWEGDCLLWTASTRGGGYGQFGHKMAHRVSYEMFVGRIPEGLNLLHSCDNKLCVNPDHLSPGTQKENLEDCVKKGRIANGTRQHLSKLDDDKVREIRRLSRSGCKQKDLAKTYEVCQGVISEVIRCKTWQHVKDES